MSKQDSKAQLASFLAKHHIKPSSKIKSKELEELTKLVTTTDQDKLEKAAKKANDTVDLLKALRTVSVVKKSVWGRVLKGGKPATEPKQEEAEPKEEKKETPKAKRPAGTVPTREEQKEQGKNHVKEEPPSKKHKDEDEDESEVEEADEDEGEEVEGGEEGEEGPEKSHAPAPKPVSKGSIIATLVIVALALVIFAGFGLYLNGAFEQFGIGKVESSVQSLFAPMQDNVKKIPAYVGVFGNENDPHTKNQEGTGQANFTAPSLYSNTQDGSSCPPLDRAKAYNVYPVAEKPDIVVYIDPNTNSVCWTSVNTFNVDTQNEVSITDVPAAISTALEKITKTPVQVTPSFETPAGMLVIAVGVLLIIAVLITVFASSGVGPANRVADLVIIGLTILFVPRIMEGITSSASMWALHSLIMVVALASGSRSGAADLINATFETPREEWSKSVAELINRHDGIVGGVLSMFEWSQVNVFLAIESYIALLNSNSSPLFAADGIQAGALTAIITAVIFAILEAADRRNPWEIAIGVAIAGVGYTVPSIVKFAGIWSGVATLSFAAVALLAFGMYSRVDRDKSSDWLAYLALGLTISILLQM